MLFFKFLSEDNKTLVGVEEKVQYEVGGEIKFNIDFNISSKQIGIQCIPMEGNTPIESPNLIFGEKVAILKIKKENIILMDENGICYARKVKVIDIIPIEYLPLKTGRNSLNFFTNFLRTAKKIQHKVEYMNFILQNKLNYYNLQTLMLYLEKVDGYFPEIEHCLLANGLYDHAIMYAICKKEYRSPIIRAKVMDCDYTINTGTPEYSKFTWAQAWAQAFPQDRKDIENLMYSPAQILMYCDNMGVKGEEAKEMTEKISKMPFNKYSVEYSKRIGTNDKLENLFLSTTNRVSNIIAYAIRYNRNTRAIRGSFTTRPRILEYEDFVEKIRTGREIKDIVLSSPKLAYQACVLGAEMTEELKSKIMESSCWTYEFLVTVGFDSTMYPAINGVDEIANLLGDDIKDKELFKSLLSQDFFTYKDIASVPLFFRYLFEYKERNPEFTKEIIEIMGKQIKPVEK